MKALENMDKKDNAKKDLMEFANRGGLEVNGGLDKKSTHKSTHKTKRASDRISETP